MSEVLATVPPPIDPLASLTGFERVAFRVMRFFNRGAGRHWALFWQRSVLIPLIGVIVSRRVRVRGLERLADVPDGAPILLVSNHRSFFDQFVLGWILLTTPRLRRRISFPVRGAFFYEKPVGLLVSATLSGGSMFPPFFREAEKMPFNKYALSLLIEQLRTQGTMVGFHPEGTRNKSGDPYTLLPAQPGVGEVALKARPVVIPAFCTGLSNDFATELEARFGGGPPILAVFGAPVELSAFPAQTRLSHHKRCADAFSARIAELGQEERAWRVEAGLPPA